MICPKSSYNELLAMTRYKSPYIELLDMIVNRRQIDNTRKGIEKRIDNV